MVGWKACYSFGWYGVVRLNGRIGSRETHGDRFACYGIWWVLFLGGAFVFPLLAVGLFVLGC